MRALVVVAVLVVASAVFSACPSPPLSGEGEGPTGEGEGAAAEGEGEGEGEGGGAGGEGEGAAGEGEGEGAAGEGEGEGAGEGEGEGEGAGEGEGEGEGAADTTPPSAPADFAAVSASRRAVTIAFGMPDDVGAGVDHCTLKHRALTAIATQADFDSIVDEIAIAAAVPGTVVTRTVSGLRTGEASSFAVECVDGAGNASPIASAFATPSLTPTSGLTTFGNADFGDFNNANAGTAVASGDLNDDGFLDVAVGAPGICHLPGCGVGSGIVYVWFGSASGLSNTPDVVIEGASDIDRLGQSLAIVDWNHDGVADLAIGAPFAASPLGNGGDVFVFFGGSPDAGSVWATGRVLSEAEASVSLLAGATDPWLGAAPGFGFSLSAANVDGDPHTGGLPDDLVIGVPGAGANSEGGAVVLLAPSSSSPSVVIPDDLVNDNSAALELRFEDPRFDFAQMGTLVATAGDIDGDGADDVLVAGLSCAAEGGGQPGVDCASATPPVNLYRGRASSSAGVVVVDFDAADASFTTSGSTLTSTFGEAVASVKRGVREIVVADPAANALFLFASLAGVQSAQGDASIVSVTGAVDLGRGLANPAVIAGESVAGENVAGGDLDGDLNDDIVATASHGTSTDFDVAFEGATSVDVFPVFQLAPLGGATRPPLVTWVGDINGDGLPDLVAADPSGVGLAVPLF